MVGRGVVGLARCVEAGSGKAWHGMVGHGVAGVVGCARAGLGKPRRGRQKQMAGVVGAGHPLDFS